MRIGFVGLGIMGHPMALNLIKGGHELFVFGKRRLPADVREAGATVCDTLKAIAERSEIIILMVPDTPDVRSVLFDPDGVAEGLSPGKIVVDMSSISPIETKLFAAEINKKGGEYLDAPVSGGEVGARAASLTIMVGGPERAFAKVKPLFELMGNPADRTPCGAILSAGVACMLAAIIPVQCGMKKRGYGKIGRIGPTPNIFPAHALPMPGRIGQAVASAAGLIRLKRKAPLHPQRIDSLAGQGARSFSPS